MNTIFVDIDGVLADFHKGILDKLKMELHEFKTKVEPNNFWWDKILGLDNNFFDYDFWTGLEKTPEADAIVLLCLQTSLDVCLLSTPMHNKKCIEGKIDWINEHYPEISYWIGEKKYYCSGPQKILIDDYDDNIRQWHIRGGKGILVPRYWNLQHNYQGSIIEHINNTLKLII